MTTLLYQKVLDLVILVSQFVNEYKLWALYLIDKYYRLISFLEIEDSDMSKDACDHVDNDKTKSCASHTPCEAKSHTHCETKARQAEGYLYILPDEILLKVFSYLSVSDWYHMGLICPRFERITWDNCLKTTTFSTQDLAVPTEFLTNHWHAESGYGMFYIAL